MLVIDDIMIQKGVIMEDKKIKELISYGREFMKMPIEDPTYRSDQELKLPQPPLVKKAMNDKAIDLPTNFDDLNISSDFLKIINDRRSERIYTEEQMPLLALSYILWCSQGVKQIKGNNYATIRTVACGGARHQFECYMIIQNVEGLDNGFYHYLPLSHQIEYLDTTNDLKWFINEALGGQSWANKANINFFYSIVAYRVEWRYGIYAHRVALIDAGHITQNVYLAATSIDLGACAIGYIDGELLNKTFKLDGNEEFIFYACPVGMIKKSETDSFDPFAFVLSQR